MPLTKTWRNDASLIAGATRNEIKLNRPWQQDLDSLLAQKCPFEPLQETPHTETSRGGESWCVLRNKFTPWTEIAPDHFLIIPRTCWRKEELRRLGQTGKLAGALTIAHELTADNAHPKFLFCVHVGRSAGQNVGHAHFHVLPLPTNRGKTVLPTEEMKAAKQKPRLKQTDDDFLIFCDGTRAGQCFIQPKGEYGNAWDTAFAHARKIDELLELYGRKFKSTQGLPPDFVMNVVMWHDQIDYVTIIPILSQWGGPEYAAALEGSPYCLPWTHELTAEHLNTNEQ